MKRNGRQQQSLFHWKVFFLTAANLLAPVAAVTAPLRLSLQDDQFGVDSFKQLAFAQVASSAGAKPISSTPTVSHRNAHQKLAPPTKVENAPGAALDRRTGQIRNGVTKIPQRQALVPSAAARTSLLATSGEHRTKADEASQGTQQDAHSSRDGTMGIVAAVVGLVVLAALAFFCMSSGSSSTATTKDTAKSKSTSTKKENSKPSDESGAKTVQNLGGSVGTSKGASRKSSRASSTKPSDYQQLGGILQDDFEKDAGLLQEKIERLGEEHGEGGRRSSLASERSGKGSENFSETTETYENRLQEILAQLASMLKTTAKTFTDMDAKDGTSWYMAALPSSGGSSKATHHFKPGAMEISYDYLGFVHAVNVDGPAHAKGVKLGDQIVKVGNQPYSEDALARAEKSGVVYKVEVQSNNWRESCMGWWPSIDAYYERQAPVGRIDLNRITNVTHDRKHPTLVILTVNEERTQFFEFDTPELATTWATAMETIVDQMQEDD